MYAEECHNEIYLLQLGIFIMVSRYVGINFNITDTILPKVEEWRNRPLKKCYAFVFIDCINIKK